MTTPLTEQVRAGLGCGEEVLLSGAVYTARDRAHAELVRLAAAGRGLPFEPEGAVVYYAGPTPVRGDGAFGSCGPTTASRMDAFTPALLEAGLAGMIGKGRRSREVRDSIKKNKAVYFLALGGAGAYLAKKIKSASLVAFGKFGPEAIYKLEVKDLPLIVGIDSEGKDVFTCGK